MIAKRRATCVVFDNSPFDIGIRRPNHSNIAIRFDAYESDVPAESTLKKTKKEARSPRPNRQIGERKRNKQAP